MPEAALRFEGAGLQFGPTHALLAFSWALQAGQVGALLGRNGAGKSLAMALAAGLIAPGTGRVMAFGQAPARARRRLGVMPQADGFDPALSPEALLRAFGGGRGGALAIAGALDFAQLSRRRHEPLQRLGLGARSRLSLAAAMVGEPDLLLCDEPFAHTDPGWIDRAFERFSALAEAGKSVLIATADPAIAARAGVVAVLRAGRLGWSGERPAERVIARLHHAGKEGRRVRELVMEDYRREIPALFAGGGGKPWEAERPVEIEVRIETPAMRLAALMDGEGEA